MISEHTYPHQIDLWSHQLRKSDMLIYDENFSDYKNHQIRPSLIKMISGHAILDKKDLWSQHRRR